MPCVMLIQVRKKYYFLIVIVSLHWTLFCLEFELYPKHSSDLSSALYLQMNLFRVHKSCIQFLVQKYLYIL